MNDKIESIDEKYSSSQSELSIKEIILRHIRKMSDLSCQELTKSYWEERPIKIGSGVSIIKKYHPDLREAFNNATDFLFTLINPYIQKDKKKIFEKAYEKIKKETDKKFAVHEKIIKKEIDKKIKSTTQDDWIFDKLDFKKQLFSEIMLFLNRIKFFTSDEFKE